MKVWKVDSSIIKIMAQSKKIDSESLVPGRASREESTQKAVGSKKEQRKGTGTIMELLVEIDLITKGVNTGMQKGVHRPDQGLGVADNFLRY